MRFKSPSSRGCFRIRFSIFDVVWAAIAPLLALFLRDAPVLSADGGATTVLLYCGISFTFSLIAFLAFRLSDGMSRHFSVYDAFNVIKAVLAAGLITSVVLFALTRLDGIPRSTPFLTVLMLAAGLFIARMVMMLLDHDGPSTEPMEEVNGEHIILIGSTQLSSLYIKFLRAYRPYQRRVTAVLDHRSNLIGRAMCGVPVIAPPQELNSVIEEFRVHGVQTDRVVIGGDENLLSEEVLAYVRRICEQRQIALEFVPKLIGLNETQPSARAMPVLVPARRPRAELPAYFQIKRVIDFVGAFAAIIILSPLFLLTGLLVLIDVGSPVLFWQQRIGQHGRNFLVHKFRTLRAPFDWKGQPAPEDQRLSWVGHFLRKLRLDELPQLFNVLVGDMSLIGPRPLLPHDQPANAGLRLSIRPGITGWAQVHGGNLVTPDEKGALDEWYIHHASLWLDLRILLLTLRFFVTGERRSEEAVRTAYAIQQADDRQPRAALKPADFPSAAANPIALRTRAGSAANQRHRRAGAV